MSRCKRCLELEAELKKKIKALEECQRQFKCIDFDLRAGWIDIKAYDLRKSVLGLVGGGEDICEAALDSNPPFRHSQEV